MEFKEEEGKTRQDSAAMKCCRRTAGSGSLSVLTATYAKNQLFSPKNLCYAYARLLIEEVAKFVVLVAGLTCKLREFVTIRYTHREGKGWNARDKIVKRLLPTVCKRLAKHMQQ